MMDIFLMVVYGIRNNDSATHCEICGTLNSHHSSGIAAHDQHKENRETAAKLAVKVAQPPVQPTVPGETSPEE